jgi:hypothetical protein
MITGQIDWRSFSPENFLISTLNDLLRDQSRIQRMALPDYPVGSLHSRRFTLGSAWMVPPFEAAATALGGN